MEIIFKQLEPFTPEEITFLQVSLPATLDKAIDQVEQQKAVLNQLKEAVERYSSKYGMYVENSVTLDYAKDNIPKYEEAIEANTNKILIMKSISDKLKQFEGII